ncbi:transcriptional regulator [Candidatus Saccharibacteria bacterium]|nr:transcriptional regulator [Candidatus Saccharibacteria bacterium]MDQ5885566.1 heat-inducible transcriptional repressor [Patescibacteria group bacterium]MDQ5953352.1 heat-inducible transcriptional repressor [Patescibacteria group bacterium]MDQ5958866.1 heat-inducible transcriptional repressor [Patescibacteria group bacterium]
MTERQAKILYAIVEQYAEVAAPVGSVLLAKTFGVSSATIRAEMARLEETGFIEQPYTSAGRIPTDKGYRFYVNAVTDLSQKSIEAGEKPLDTVNRNARAIDVRVKSAGRSSLTIRSAVDSLVDITHNLSIATIGDQLYMSGISYLFSQPEFTSGDAVQEVAKLLDNLEPWLQEASPNEPLSVYIGAENPIGKSSGCSLIISKYRSPYSDRSYIGVVGPTRQSYKQVMGLVRHTGQLLERVL